MNDVKIVVEFAVAALIAIGILVGILIGIQADMCRKLYEVLDENSTNENKESDTKEDINSKVDEQGE